MEALHIIFGILGVFGFGLSVMVAIILFMDGF